MRITKITENEALEMYNEMLNETCESFKVGQLEYEASRVLYEVDPIAYRTGFTEWLDYQEDIEVEGY